MMWIDHNRKKKYLLLLAAICAVIRKISLFLFIQESHKIEEIK